MSKFGPRREPYGSEPLPPLDPDKIAADACHRLWSKAIDLALQDLTAPLGSERRSAAVAWYESDAFDLHISLIGLDPEVVRERIEAGADLKSLSLRGRPPGRRNRKNRRGKPRFEEAA